jgi:hypothetical protein
MPPASVELIFGQRVAEDWLKIDTGTRMRVGKLSDSSASIRAFEELQCLAPEELQCLASRSRL